MSHWIWPNREYKFGRLYELFTVNNFLLHKISRKMPFQDFSENGCFLKIFTYKSGLKFWSLLITFIRLFLTSFRLGKLGKKSVFCSFGKILLEFQRNHAEFHENFAEFQENWDQLQDKIAKNSLNLHSFCKFLSKMQESIEIFW